MWTRERHNSTFSTDVLARFANFKLAGDRAVRDAADVITGAVSGAGAAAAAASPSALTRNTSRGARRRRRRGTYARRRTSSRRIHSMSDADLEAELAARRAQRARERERYARAMRSDKLQLLEMELHKLRSKMPGEPNGHPRIAGAGGGTPANSRWESLDGRRSPSLNSSVPRRHHDAPGTPVPNGGPNGGPPPPGPPPPPPMMPDDDEPVDPEKQKREKEERQRRREAKRKEREAAKKPMTLADIIRSAGKNPMARLKPKGSTATVDVNDPQPQPEDELSKVELKKAEPKEEKKQVEEKSELSKVVLKKTNNDGQQEVQKIVEEFLKSVIDVAVGDTPPKDASATIPAAASSSSITPAPIPVASASAP